MPGRKRDTTPGQKYVEIDVWVRMGMHENGDPSDEYRVVEKTIKDITKEEIGNPIDVVKWGDIPEGVKTTIVARAEAAHPCLRRLQDPGAIRQIAADRVRITRQQNAIKEGRKRAAHHEMARSSAYQAIAGDDENEWTRNGWVFMPDEEEDGVQNKVEGEVEGEVEEEDQAPLKRQAKRQKRHISIPARASQPAPEHGDPKESPRPSRRNPIRNSHRPVNYFSRLELGTFDSNDDCYGSEYERSGSEYEHTDSDSDADLDEDLAWD
ncbi:hypothetical protein RSOLAG22IIIB_08035 [Rhizoctonia solani]|uniref:Uncharacterized protein n=1 Tax=Rhizoctonia solani TaxID=456999 RepID=A0A0K6FQW0_9AGAM|nr:hypothetical protein RSOLAG22IIIB_08035 [Rhizoctonia solani]